MLIKIPIHISSAVTHINVTIVSSSSLDNLEVLDEAEALVNGEAPYQIREGGSYEYEIDKGFQLEEIAGIISRSKLHDNLGRITPNIYVGTLPISIIDTYTSAKCGEFKIEVQSVKTTYREDYRFMLEEIAEKSTDLLMQLNSPVIQTFTIDFERDAKTAYQRFAFIKSIIDSEEFENAVQKIVSSPTTKWKTSTASKSIHSIKKFEKKVIRQISTSSNRIYLPTSHPLKLTFNSIPEKLQVSINKETVNTPENRFIKFALETFLAICGEFSQLKNNDRAKREASQLEEKLAQYLNHLVFKEVSNVSSLPLNSPVLQRKEGYREVFRSWMLFDLAAKLIWAGGEDVYSGNKKDVAVLYEYWLFFKLIETITEVFEIDHPKLETLIKETTDGLGLQIKQGEYLAIDSVSNVGNRKLIIQLNYNRSYAGDQPYPNAGSWSRNLRPDYTLSIWPYGISSEQAEKEELIVHIHFDAKYKIESFQELYSKEVELDREKEEQRKGTYKRADLLKMHAYRDAIRRTAGAYVLYPGGDLKQVKKGFHEIIPGLGAFAIRPSKIDSGIEELKAFLIEVTKHLMNRASQRERMTYKTYETYSDGNRNEVNELIPEAYGENRNLVPQETYVLVAFYRGSEHLQWIEKTKLYNSRTGSTTGSLYLSPKETGARYLLLHGEGETKTSKLYKLSNKGLRIFSKSDLIKNGYPMEPTRDFYLVYAIEGKAEQEFEGKSWDITKLKAYESKRRSADPFPTSLAELMGVVVKTK